VKGAAAAAEAGAEAPDQKTAAWLNTWTVRLPAFPSRLATRAHTANPCSRPPAAPVNVITSDGRCIVGVLRGFDTTNNLVLEDCHERVFSPQSGVEQIALGLYFVRGDNVAVVGELDDDLEANQDLSALTAQPLKPIRHG
jgi:U6 snRNA-associated Sm-like protein LSm8